MTPDKIQSVFGDLVTAARAVNVELMQLEESGVYDADGLSASADPETVLHVHDILQRAGDAFEAIASFVNQHAIHDPQFRTVHAQMAFDMVSLRDQTPGVIAYARAAAVDLERQRPECFAKQSVN